MRSNTSIRHEQPRDIGIIADLTRAAFLEAEHASYTEHFIVDALRQCDQLTLSLVAEANGEIVGHVAISPVTISSGVKDWFGLGPVSVGPEHQRQGIGSALIRAALDELKRSGGRGCGCL